MPRVVFDTGAVPHFANHGEVIRRPALDAFCFEKFALCFKVFELFIEFMFDVGNGAFLFLGIGHEVFRWEDVDEIFFTEYFGRHGIDFNNGCNDVACEVDLVHDRVRNRHDVDFVAKCAKLPTLEIGICT